MKQLKVYFHFTRSQRYSIFVLLVIIIGLGIAIPFLSSIKEQPMYDFEKFEAFVDSLQNDKLHQSNTHKNLPTKKASFVKKKQPTITPKKAITKKIEYFEFNPNTASKSEWQRLGLSEKIAARIRKYCSKGGSFKKKVDLKKIYGFTEKDYLRLKNFIRIPKPNKVAYSSKKVIKRTFQTKSKKDTFKVDINVADATTWRRLRGIGKVYAKRIIKFRNALGGFSHIDQVAETYGLPDSTFRAIKPYLIKNTVPVCKKLNINTVSTDTLRYHPYLKWHHANAIVNYRLQHGSFKALEDLYQIKVIDSLLFEKITPYLELQH